MNNKIKTFIANIPLYLGVLSKLIGERLVQLSLITHVVLKTPLGLKVKSYQENLIKMAEMMKKAQAAQAQEANKLNAVLTQDQTPVEELPEGVISLGKKRTESKD